MGPTSSRSLARVCKALSHQRPPLEAAGRVLAGDVFSLKCREEKAAFPNKQRWSKLGDRKQLQYRPRCGAHSQCQEAPHPVQGKQRRRPESSDKTRQQEGTLTTAYLERKLGPTERARLPGGKTSFFETLKSLQEDSITLAQAFSWGRGAGGDAV